MATQRLVIDCDAPGQFLLLARADSITLDGDGGPRVLESVRVTRIHCVLEVEAELLRLQSGDPQSGEPPQELTPGAVLESAGVRLLLEPAVAPLTGTPPHEPTVKRRLLVLAGAEPGRDFPLPDAGVVTLGKDRQRADILLLGFKVEPVHCHVTIDGNRVEVVDEGSLGTLVNGKRVTRQELRPGDILRVGNNQLRLDVIGLGEEFPPLPVRQKQDAEARRADESTPYEVLGETEEDEPLPAGASEAVVLLHEWRKKLTQLSGQSFGHYQLGAMLGRGRSGVVFRAVDNKSGQTVALKIFSPQFPQGNDELQRFAGVMKPLLPLRHPHLVGVQAAGKTGIWTWIAREFVEGESLARMLRRLARGAPPDPPLACRVGIHIGRALDFARRQHLRHGAIRPANILIQHSDQAVKLADLMLAQALGQSQLAQAILEDRALTDLAFLSPEQASPGDFVDELSDLYGLGAVMYALVTGRPPFTGDSAAAILQQIRSATRVTRPKALGADTPPALETVVLKLLAKRQEDRYQTPAELLSDLEPIAEAEEIAV